MLCATISASSKGFILSIILCNTVSKRGLNYDTVYAFKWIEGSPVATKVGFSQLFSIFTIWTASSHYQIALFGSKVPISNCTFRAKDLFGFFFICSSGSHNLTSWTYNSLRFLVVFLVYFRIHRLRNSKCGVRITNNSNNTWVIGRLNMASKTRSTDSNCWIFVALDVFTHQNMESARL